MIASLANADVSPATALLTRAFRDNPVYRAVLGHLTPERRAEAIRRVKWGFVQAGVRHQEARGVWAEDQLAGVALILAPGQYPTPLLAEAWQSMGCATTGPRAILHFLRLRSYIAKMHVQEPHYYLFALGIDPAHQRKGLGRALLADLHQRAKTVACYLETDTPENVRLYESVGYHVLSDENVPGLPDLRYWTMRRPPA